MCHYESGKGALILAWKYSKKTFGDRAPPRPVRGAYGVPPDPLAGLKAKGYG